MPCYVLSKTECLYIAQNLMMRQGQSSFSLGRNLNRTLSPVQLHSSRLFIKTSMSRVSNKVSSWAAFMASSSMSKVHVNPFCIILQILYSVAKIMQIIYSIKKNIKKKLFYFVLSSIGTILKYGEHFIPCPISRQTMSNISHNQLSINTHRQRLINHKKDNPVWRFRGKSLSSQRKQTMRRL